MYIILWFFRRFVEWSSSNYSSQPPKFFSRREREQPEIVLETVAVKSTPPKCPTQPPPPPSPSNLVIPKQEGNEFCYYLNLPIFSLVLDPEVELLLNVGRMESG